MLLSRSATLGQYMHFTYCMPFKVLGLLWDWVCQPFFRRRICCENHLSK